MIQYLSLQGLLAGDPVTIILIGIAGWRVAHLLMEERGPWDAFVRLRGLFGVQHDRDKVPNVWPDGSVLACMWCLSIWVVLALAMLPLIVSGIFAAATVSLAVGKAIEGQH